VARSWAQLRIPVREDEGEDDGVVGGGDGDGVDGGGEVTDPRCVVVHAASAAAAAAPTVPRNALLLITSR
jgi:hypothetical protein